MFVRTVLVILAFACTAAHAKRFRNSYVSFELPPNWNCKVEGSEWVCENDFSGRIKEAIILLTAKEMGPGDTLERYMAHLQSPLPIPGHGGTMTKSQVINVKQRMIGNQMWIDALHLGSEVGPYFTRYLATIRNHISILVTFSAHKDQYTKYSGDFMKAVESMAAVAGPDALGDRGAFPNLDASAKGPVGIIGQGGQGPVPFDVGTGLPAEENGKPKGHLATWFALAMILAALGGYFFLQQKRKQKSSKKKKGPE